MEAKVGSNHQMEESLLDFLSSTSDTGRKILTPYGSSGSDSGYGSLDKSPTSLQQTSSSGLAKAFKKKRYLLPFDDISIPEVTYNRFEDLQRQFGKLFYNFLKKSYTNPGHVSAKLIVMGDSRETAKPCVVVQCEDTIAAKVKQFFRKKEVKSHYQPHDQDPSFPDLEVFVQPYPPRLRALYTEQDVWRERSPITGAIYHPKVLGSRIKTLAGDGSERIATLGGFIWVSHSGYETIYGLTVGHIFSAPLDFVEDDRGVEMVEDGLREMIINSDDEDDHDGDNNGDDSAILDFGLHQDDAFERIILNLENEQDNTNDANERSLSTPDDHDADSSKPSPACLWTKVSRTVYTSSLPRGSKLGDNKDWALLEFTRGWPVPGDAPQDFGLYSMDTPSIRYSPDSFEIALGRPVMILTPPISQSYQGNLRNQPTPFRRLDSPRNYREGYLMTTFSFLMLSSGSDFTKTYGLKFSDGDDLRPGECGAWVVDADTGELYGHVVASDDLGQAYVVPAQLTFKDIQESLKALAVDVPSYSELCAHALTMLDTDLSNHEDYNYETEIFDFDFDSNIDVSQPNRIEPSPSSSSPLYDDGITTERSSIESHYSFPHFSLLGSSNDSAYASHASSCKNSPM